MTSDIHLDGLAFALRPVRRDDAAMIVRLRRDPRARFLHPTDPRVAVQEAYLDAYFARAGDYYFVIERRSDGAVEGLIALYDVDPQARSAEWGRWVLKPGSLAAVESALLIYRVAFEVLGLEQVRSRTAVANRAVVSFHDSCGIPRRAILPDHFHLEGGVHDAVEHVLTRADWPVIREALAARTARLGRRLGRTEAPG